MNNKIVFGVGGIIIGLLLAIFFTSALLPYRNGGFGMMGWRTNSVSNQEFAGTSTIDRHFIEQMIPHHDGAIAMANLALQKSKRPEIKTLAQAIVSAQESENQQMKNWYKDWFGKDVPKDSAMMGGMMSQGGMHMGGSQDINVLKNADDFDKEFIEQMIPHHQMAIMMARMLESGTARPEMLQLAKNIQTSQAAEIQQMQGWYAVWYK
ncbi:MAG: DUF305 domain-containing protein [Patescibacteria group bacterium]